MRFTPFGPSIPHELLNARDEGRVVFFCGAGVSRARAGLPDFFGLADAVIKSLGVPDDNDACRVLLKARELGSELSITGLISADRVFSLLEREFTTTDIQAAVARSLAPENGVNHSAHALLLRLARTPDSRTQLVTTNFDRLFELPDSQLRIYQPPRLPNPSKYDDLDGIVYLHGRASSDYTHADGAGFILSSSDFGHAYLSEGWATDFFREVVRKYVVVFVGYSADDPPVHYLLEGLLRTPDESRHIYAFQADESDETIARWNHKGVKAIPYSRADGHTALWETLERWAERADNPLEWRLATIRGAMNGPEKLQPHQRGQLAHIVSTYEGARDFAEIAPPAEWLCSFDPTCRYASPERSEWLNPESPLIDPFTLYGLDSDTAPPREPPDDQSAKREIPRLAFDALINNRLDLADASSNHFSTLRGPRACLAPSLPKRLGCLGVWIGKVAKQPTAVWWAARQQSLHPSIQYSIQFHLERAQDFLDPTVKEAWTYLIEAWQHANDSSDGDDRYNLEHEIKKYGWNSAILRRFVAISRPYVKVAHLFKNRSAPPRTHTELKVWDLVKLEVECPVPLNVAGIPDEWLEAAIRGLRENIELAVRLCAEVGDWQPTHIVPITPDTSPGVSKFARARGLSGVVLQFSSLFERLLGLNKQTAQHEFSAWPLDDTAFCKLRIWACGLANFLRPSAFSRTLAGISDEAFWDHRHQRDLLFVLAKRWSEISQPERKRIETRLLKGPLRWENENEPAFAERRARSILERIEWLAINECELSFDREAEAKALIQRVPNWKLEYAIHAADSLESRGGTVSINRNYKDLITEPIASILSKAQATSGRDRSNFLEEYAPFEGLSDARPRRAYLALARAASANEFPEWAWRIFLNSQAREKDTPRLRATIARRICGFSAEITTSLLYSCTHWLRENARHLSQENPTLFDNVTQRLIDAIELEDSQSRPTLTSSNEGKDWATEALNAPVGHLAMAILEDARIASNYDSVPHDAKWLTQLKQLLELPGNLRCQAIAIISHHLGWFHRVAPEWTRIELLSILGGDSSGEMAAFWSGFFWNPRVTSKDMFLRLKPALIALANERNRVREGYVQSLAHLILENWAAGEDAGEPLVTDNEFREVLLHGGDEFRSQVLWLLARTFDQSESESDQDGEAKDEWITHTKRLFEDVWPRQRSVKTPTMSMRLVELVTTDVHGFSKLCDLVLPLLERISQGQGLHLPRTIHEIIETSARQVLRILHIILPDEVSNWPYETHDLLELIGKSDSSLQFDSQYRDLMLKWNAR